MTDGDFAAAVSQLMARLRGLSAADQPEGGEAAAILAATLARPMTAKARLSSLSYALGGKGLFDWSWSAAALAALQPAAAEAQRRLRELAVDL